MVAGQRYATGDGAGGWWRWRMAKSRAWYFGFISSFMSENRRDGREAERPSEDRERGTLNYNPLRDTAEFAFKIKRP